jgi:hypothetical protein
MSKELAYTYWKDGDWLAGYLNDYPDYWTQGKTLKELETMLSSLYEDISSDTIPFVRHQGVLRMNNEEN